ncbi:hypothetical protein [Sphingomonas sp. IW22]|uniref:hypothetical protein n=1 Tax=Sphingomonas sp. IW22 TaxID=3242489 RepID=UPI0035225A0C
MGQPRTIDDLAAQVAAQRVLLTQLTAAIFGSFGNTKADFADFAQLARESVGFVSKNLSPTTSQPESVLIKAMVIRHLDQLLEQSSLGLND